MKLERDDTKVGLLVLAALAIFLGLLFHRMIRATLRREVAYHVRIESVASLPVGTEVQLLGLRVGQVKTIEMRRDGVRYHFLVTLGLRPDIVLWRGTRAVVSSQLFGSSYLDLQLPEFQERTEELQPGGTMEGWMGASVGDLVTDLDVLVKNLDQGVNELRTELQTRGLGALLDHPNLRKTLVELDSTLGAFRVAAQEAGKALGHGDRTLQAVDRNLASLEKSLDALGTLLTRRGPELDTAIRDLSATLTEMKALAGSLNHLVQRAGPEAEATLRTLHRDLAALEELLELLKQKPNRVLWGTPSEVERNAARQRADEARRQAPSPPAPPPQ